MAITILLLVILPLATLYVRSLTVIQNAALYSQALQIGQERIEVCQALNYGSLYYYNQVFAPGFPFYEPALPPAQTYDRDGARMNPLLGTAYDNRDIPETDWIDVVYDPTDSDGGFLAERYPVPVYRDYYNNYTGQLLDPNFNGLCDDDLDGDGEAGILAEGGIDMEDIEIATNGLLTMYSDPQFSTMPAAGLGSTYVPGDGLYDTVVEGNYVTAMDPMYRMIRITESPTPILDVGLLYHHEYDLPSAVPDFRHRERTFQNFVRMTTFIDPTPTLANPNDVNTWVDALYIRNRREDDGYTAEQIQKLRMCLLRDLPLLSGLTSFDVGVDDAGLVELDPFNANYTPPVYGIKVIVAVFYLTGEAEMQLADVDGDGIVEEVPQDTYGGARRIRLERTFYNDINIDGQSKSYAPPRRYILSTAGNVDNPARSLTLPDVEDNGDDSDPCDIDHDGLPYLTD